MFFFIREINTVYQKKALQVLSIWFNFVNIIQLIHYLWLHRMFILKNLINITRIEFIILNKIRYIYFLFYSIYSIKYFRMDRSRYAYDDIEKKIEFEDKISYKKGSLDLKWNYFSIYRNYNFRSKTIHWWLFS